MATASFESWFHGAPLALSVGDTKTFAYWFHGAVLLLPDLTQTSGSNPLAMRARIIRLPSELASGARIARQQGWPILNAVDPGFPLFQPTQLNVRVRITQGSRSTQTFDMRANIQRGATERLTVRARIVTAATLAMRARVKPFRSRSTAVMLFSVANERQAKALMLFYTQGNAYAQTMSMRARISKPYQTRAAHTIVVSKTGSGSSVLTFDLASDQTTLQQLRIGARIVAP